MPCTTIGSSCESALIRPDAGGTCCEDRSEEYFAPKPFRATKMTLGEFRSCCHHAGYEGADSEMGYLVELPHVDAIVIPRRSPPKVWIDAETFALTYHRTGDRASRTASEHDAAYVTNEANQVSIPRRFQTDPQAWSDTTGQAMAGSPTPEEAPPAYMGGYCTQDPSMAG